jgi:hypothetical protein
MRQSEGKEKRLSACVTVYPARSASYFILPNNTRSLVGSSWLTAQQVQAGSNVRLRRVLALLPCRVFMLAWFQL